MSFKLFVYYCALLGGWAAFVAWAVVQGSGIRDLQSKTLYATLTGAILGTLVAAAIGLLDALLNARPGQRVFRVLLCGMLGLAGGAFGGLVGQLLYGQLGIPLFVGWILAGVLIGASIGVFDLLGARSSGDRASAIKKVLNGVYGGFLGGFVGGLPFTYLIDSPALPRSNLTLGLVVLGICIGLMVGLAQVVLKDAWLRVESGFRAGRELMLTKDLTTIGRAESCDLGLFGDRTVEKLHARITIDRNRYWLAHAGEEGETLLNDEPVGIRKPQQLRSGDTIRVGNSVLVFRERQKRK
jgi:hypothetical protein